MKKKKQINQDELRFIFEDDFSEFLSPESIGNILLTNCCCKNKNCLVKLTNDMNENKKIIYHNRNMLIGLSIPERKNFLRDKLESNYKTILFYYISYQI